MKKIFFLLFSVLTLSLSAQTPQAFNYQGVARDNKGAALVNTNISLRMSILSGSASGTAEYVETHSVTTDAYGLFTRAVGGGTAGSGTFSQISWGSNTKFLKVEMDAAGGTNYLFMGTSQLLSVPYALYSEKSGNTYKAGSGIEIDGEVIENTAPDQTVTLTGAGATTVSGTYPDFTISSTDDVDDADADPKNELQTLDINGGRVSLTSGGFVKLPDSSATNEIQTLSLTGSKIALTNGGGSITLPDSSATNEVQTLSRTGNKIALTNGGGSITLPDSNYWSKNADTLYYTKGFVGIGTKSPKSELEVKSLYGRLITNGNVLSLSSNNAGYGAGIYMYGGGATSEWAWAATPNAGVGLGDDQFQLQRITSSGTTFPFVVTNAENIGIGTRNPTSRLFVEGSGNVELLRLNKTSGSNDFIGFYANGTLAGTIGARSTGEIFIYHTKTSSFNFFMASNGNIGLGTQSPSSKLHVVGDICYTGSIGSCSDLRYKKDIRPIGNSLDKVMRMNGVYYNWKIKEYPEQNFTEKNQVGFIAQDIEKLFPELVMTDEKGYKSVDYSKVTPILVEALKEQQKLIELQQQRLEKLEQKVEGLQETAQSRK